MIRSTLFATASIFALSVLSLPALADPRDHQGMLSMDTTQGRTPVFHDNGVNDGRICKISLKKVYDPWTEDYVVRKVKQCF